MFECIIACTNFLNVNLSENVLHSVDGEHRRIQNPVKHLRSSVLRKIVNGSQQIFANRSVLDV